MSMSDEAIEVDRYSESASNSSAFSPPPAKQPSIPNRQNLTNLALMCERFDAPDRAGAAIASAVLKDFGVIDDSALENVIDQSKLKREHQKCRQKLRDEKCNFGIVNAISADGRKDATLTTIETSDWKVYRKTEIEEHYVIVGKLGELYWTNFSVEDGKEVIVGKAFYKEMENTDLQNSLSIVGSNRTEIMTGKHHGSIATLKQLLQRPLQWVICLLHTHQRITFQAYL